MHQLLSFILLLIFVDPLLHVIEEVVESKKPGILTKLQLYNSAAAYYGSCTDAPEKATSRVFVRVPGENARGVLQLEQRRVRVIFVRHGHSFWDAVRNPEDQRWLHFLGEALLWEARSVATPHDSAFYDAPLTHRGMHQSLSLRGKIFVPRERAAVVTSNLRQAIETALTAFPDASRLYIDSSLQEGCCRADALSLITEEVKRVEELPPIPLRVVRGGAVEGPVEVRLPDVPRALGVQLNLTFNAGNKPSRSDVFRRHEEFLVNIFAPGRGFRPLSDDATSAADTLIVVGHAAWFRHFFARYTPSATRSFLSRKELANCAAVSFDVEVSAASGVRVLGDSIEFLHGGLA